MAAPKTVLTYPLNGANKDFTIPFEYLARKFVSVALIGKTRKTLTLNSDYRFTTRTTITTTKAWGPADGFESIEIRRVTSATERLVDFSDGSILRAYDLNTSQVQSLHIAEEARDLTADTIAVNNDGDLDARGRKIVNVADAVLDGDAINLRQEKAWAQSALNQADRSKTEADRSTLYANESSRHAGNSATSSSASAQSEGVAYQAASTAVANANTAISSAITAVANTNASKAWASTAEDVLVTPGLYSSLHYSRKSATSAAASATSASQSYADAYRSALEANRAASEASKLGNANQFMGTIRDVSGFNVRFKGTHLIQQALYIARQGLDDPTDYYSISNEPNQVLYVRNWQGTPLSSMTVSGEYAVRGSLRSDAGSVFSSSPNAANAHYWFEGPDGNRGVIYAGEDQNIHIRAGRERLGLSITPDGHVIARGSIYMQGATIPSNADIRTDWLQGGSLYSALNSVKSGTRIRNVPTVIWERGTDTAGGTGDQGAAGSTLYLREALLPGDFYMFEIYGGAKFYSTTNCIPYGDSPTEEHNVQFDAGGAMLFVLTEGGRRITVRAGKPSNQYGIRRVFLFKLQLA